jgi:hypothetical protein
MTSAVNVLQAWLLIFTVFTEATGLVTVKGVLNTAPVQPSVVLIEKDPKPVTSKIPVPLQAPIWLFEASNKQKLGFVRLLWLAIVTLKPEHVVLVMDAAPIDGTGANSVKQFVETTPEQLSVCRMQ